MPAIQVARTDTFEAQRQKINEIGSQVFSITQGGSDLSTGNLKLGDGTRTNPSLAFSSDISLGIYKPDSKTIGYVSDGKKVADFAPSGFYSFRDLIIQQKTLIDSGISILNLGTNYDPGSYSNISIIGGTGELATASIEVTKFSGSINNTGKNYTPGSYSNIPLVGGSGTGATASFTVDALSGEILTAGTGYISGTYQGIPLTNGSGTGSTADVIIIGGSTISGSITNPGSGYTPGQYSQLLVYNTPRQTFAVTSISNPGTPPPDNVYVIDSITQDTLTLEKGNTYRFDVSDSSVASHPLSFVTTGNQTLSQDYYSILTVGSQGSSGAYVYLTIKPDAPTETINYICTVHQGMGGTINIVSGTIGSYGTGASAQATVGISGIITDFQFTASGQDYKQNDVVTAFIASGSGFTYTISELVYNGVVSSVTIVDNGINYENGDILSFDNSSVGGIGSGFQYSISTDPGIISNFLFTDKGNNYEIQDLLSLGQSVDNVSTNLKGQVTNVSSSLDTNSATITIASTSGILAGMLIDTLQGSDGALSIGTTVLSIDSSTQLTLSEFPIASGNAFLRFYSDGNLNEIIVSDVSGIYVNSVVEKVSGNGTLAENTRVQSINANTNTITLTETPTLSGSIVVNFIPPYGNGDGNFEFEITNVGNIESFTISSGGNGYSVGDELSVNSFDLTQPIIYTVGTLSSQRLELSSPVATGTFAIGDFIKLRDQSVITVSTTTSTTIIPTVVSNLSTTLSDASPIIIVSDTTGISQGMIVTQSQGDAGSLPQGSTTVLSVDSSTQVTLSGTPLISGSATLTFTTDESGIYTNLSSTTDSSNGSGSTFSVSRQIDGSIQSINVNNGGYFYEIGDSITIDGSLVGGDSITDDIVLEVSTITESEEVEIYDLEISGSNIISLLVETPITSFLDNDVIRKISSTDTYDISDAGESKFKFLINTGSGLELTPDLTLYSGNTYRFSVTSISSTHDFAFSKYEGGEYLPSLIENISSTLDNSTNVITVANTTEILEGMSVNVISGSGVLLSGTTVASVVNSTTLNLSDNPVTSGAVILSFAGVEYTDNVTKDEDYVTIRVTDDTPNLYYYCKQPGDLHNEEGKSFSGFALITTDNNNPKTFGSGFLISIAELESNDVIRGNITDGSFISNTITSTVGNFDVVNSDDIICTDLISTTISTTSISSVSNLSISANNTNISGNLNIGSNIQMVASSGNITTSGVLKTTNSVNINDRITITNNNISSTSGSNILLSPAVGRVAKINTTSALTIPSGTTAQRPTSGVVENGSIRFNTETGQYEGYSAATGSWSSLGGVRDLDGNTYIAAEASIGANDNTLYFFNDGNNTVSVTPNYLQFVNVKKIRSVNTTAPVSTEYTTNTQVVLGQYLKYRNNIYEVTIAGQTGTSGNEPTHTTGSETNGTAELTWYASAVAPLTFEEVSEVRIDPLGFTDLVVNDELRFSNNIISTDLNDLVIRPNSGKKVTIDAESSLVIPVGDNNQRGVAEQGSIRYNTDISQYEGYDGANWTSLGGVKDVDGNTYIIPETAPGANENILYFYNDGTNTMRLSTNALDFTNIDTITSQNNNLDIETQTVTFNNLAATIDTSGTSTFISTTKDNLDLGLAVGLNVDPLLRLDVNGDIYLNKAFGTGSFDGLKLFNSDLSIFELADLAISTSDIGLIKGGTNAGAATLYDPASQSGARVSVSVVNQTTGDKEMIEYQVIDKGSDIYHTEIGNLKTGANQVTSVFDFDANNNVRVTFTLDDNLTVGDVVNITVVKNIFKN
jgi:hypothetical protein